MPATRKRRPGWVYDAGSEPDPRFSFANERTFLAWIRTSLALIAAGVALRELIHNLEADVRRACAGVLIALGVSCAVVAYLRWARNERALRRAEPLPAPALALLVAAGVFLVGIALVVVIATA